VIEQDLLVRSITEATKEVFSTMLDMEIESLGMATDATAGGSALISLIGITGEWAGSGVLCCSPALAARICTQMLGTEADGQAITEEVLDVVAEVSNMVVGNIKNGLETVTGPLAMSVPTVIHGRNFQFRNALGLRGAALEFGAGEERFEVRISLAPSTESSASRTRMPVLGLAHV
jgi:chemotaxis protein CheX